MKRTSLVFAILFVCAALVAKFSHAQTPNQAGSPSPSKQSPPSKQPPGIEFPAEKHLRHVRQLTFTGENAEAYFNGFGTKIIFQSKYGSMPCDQIFKLDTDGTHRYLISTGKGRTTCSYFFPDGEHIIYSSTHLASPACPPPPDYSHGYVWAIYPSYDIFTADDDGGHLKRLTATDGYDAEATISVDGKHIVFTSMRDGDLDIYSMDADGSNVKRLTNELGYDGGAFYSRDGKKIVYRANHPQTPAEIARYKQMLAANLVEPNALELWMMDADGSHKQQVTHLGVASFAPYFMPDGKRIIFSSNYPDIHSRDFNLFLINTDGTGLEQVTYNDTFDGFPMLSPDGHQIVFASNRNAAVKGDTNIFIANWIE
jgi:TolB protein